MRHLLSAGDLDRAAIESLLDEAEAINAAPRSRPPATGLVAALAFFEPSLRTRVGFEAAAARLGVATTLLAGGKRASAMSAGESLADTLRVVGAEADAILLRHPDPEAPALAAAVAGVPVVNCGNGSDEHPTQALIDLLAIRDALGAVAGARIAIVGDLLHMRVAHSLLLALRRFDGVRARLVSPPELRAPAPLREGAEETAELRLDDVDIVYMAGFAPVTPAGTFPDEVRQRYALDATAAASLAPHARVLCPLPRVDEISAAVDDTPHAAYFRQNALAKGIRAAVLRRALALVAA